MSKIRNRIVDLANEALTYPGMKDPIRGLGLFIADIRKCKSKEAELKRVNKELGNIRNKFKDDKTLDGYQRKKYISKLLFIYLYGYKVDIGFVEAIGLLNNGRFSERSIGYIFVSVVHGSDLVTEQHNLLISVIRNDLRSNSSFHSILALQTMANICDRTLVDALGSDVYRILINTAQTDASVLPSAIPCFLAMLRIKNELAPSTHEDVTKLCSLMKSTKYTTVLTSINLIQELMLMFPEKYQICLPTIFGLLEHVIEINEKGISVSDEYIRQDQFYYSFYRPWIYVKLLRLLKYFTYDDQANMSLLRGLVERTMAIVEAPMKSKRSHHINSKYAIAFEVISLIIQLDMDQKIIFKACSILMCPLNSSDASLRGLGLKSLCALTRTEHGRTYVDKLTKNIIDVLKSEKEADVRQIGFDVACAVCNKSNVKVIVSEMLNCLKLCPYSSRQELALKIAIMAEKYVPGYNWYVDKTMELVQMSGELVSDNVWFRIVRVITNVEEVQGYAAKRVFECLQSRNTKETMVKVGAYILGEFGNLIAGDERSSPLIQFRLLRSFFSYVGSQTKYIIVTTAGKMANLFPEIKPQIEEFLQSQQISCSFDVELQQRGVEMLRLARSPNTQLLVNVFEVMPRYNDVEVMDNVSVDNSRDSIPSALQQESPYQTADANKNEGTPCEPQRGEYFFDSHQVSVDRKKQQTKDTSERTFGAERELERFIFDQSGILFSSNIVQIFATVIHGTSLNPVCQVSLVVENLSGSPLTNVIMEAVEDSASFQCVSLAFTHCLPIGPGQKGQVMVTAMIKSFFKSPIDFRMDFICGKEGVCYNLCLPLHAHHFVIPISMSAEDFLSRWKSLSTRELETSDVFTTKKQMERTFIERVLYAHRMEILIGVDPNPFNFCAAGALYFSNSNPVGILLRIEQNSVALTYRLTVRAARSETSQQIAAALRWAMQ